MLRSIFLLFFVLTLVMAFGQDRKARKEFDLGKEAHGRRELTAAVMHYSRAIDADGKFVDAYLMRSSCYHLMNAKKLALADLDAILAFAPERADVMEMKGDLLHLMGQVPAALDAHRAALKLAGGRKDTLLFNVGYDHMRLGQLDSANHYYQKTLEVTPTFQQARSNMAFVHLMQERFEEAAVGYRAELERDPRDHLAWSNLSYAEMRQGQLDSAMVHIERSIAIRPENSWAYRNRGLIYKAMGSSGPACRDLQRALDRGFEQQWGAEDIRELREYCRPVGQ